MGKYMKKAKMSGEVAVMEVSPQSTLGVRTRARALALQRLQDPSACPSGVDSASYLQLRSRRLEKPSVLVSQHPAAKEGCKRDSRPNPSLPAEKPRGSPAGPRPVNSGSVGSTAFKGRCDRTTWVSEEDDPLAAFWEPFPESDGGGVEVSFGENVLEFESRERNTRETTPCSLILSSDNIATPGSTTRRTNNANAANRRTQSAVCWNMPTTLEMEEFFAGAEQIQQRIFLEKYNYDPAHDCPLPGRYEWIRIDA